MIRWEWLILAFGVGATVQFVLSLVIGRLFYPWAHQDWKP